MYQSSNVSDSQGVNIGAQGNSVGAGGTGHHKKVKKKKVRGSMFGFFGGSHKPVDLSKIFTNATLRAQAESESQRRELGISEDAEDLTEDPGSLTSSLTNGVGETKNIMHQNMNKLNERGEKLDQLRDQTNKMMLSAMRFEEQVSLTSGGGRWHLAIPFIFMRIGSPHVPISMYNTLCSAKPFGASNRKTTARYPKGLQWYE